jgi:hypothetical protein
MGRTGDIMTDNQGVAVAVEPEVIEMKSFTLPVIPQPDWEHIMRIWSIEQMVYELNRFFEEFGISVRQESSMGGNTNMDFYNVFFTHGSYGWVVLLNLGQHSHECGLGFLRLDKSPCLFVVVTDGARPDESDVDHSMKALASKLHFVREARVAFEKGYKAVQETAEEGR